MNNKYMEYNKMNKFFIIFLFFFFYFNLLIPKYFKNLGNIQYNIYYPLGIL